MLLNIDNDCMAYDWGSQGRISALLGRSRGPVQEAELWLGAHPKAPSKFVDTEAQWTDAHQWEQLTGRRLEFLLKILAAERPLSLQAHPAAAQAESGFAREEAAGIPIDAPHRNYRDSRPKPEMLVALEDGFQALCGFRSTEQIMRTLDAVRIQLPQNSATAAGRALGRWQELLSQAAERQDELGDVVAWLLTAEESAAVVPALLAAAAAEQSGTGTEEPGPWRLIRLLQESHPGDRGIAVAVMLHHLTLRAGESLWLPAGVLHSYVQGLGVELMGPSDNVLRGGLTSKHVDTAELLCVADLTPRAVHPSSAVPVGDHVVAPRPAGQEGAPFELLEITGSAEVEAPGPSVLIVLDGRFRVSADGENTPAASEAEETRTAGRGDQLLHTGSGRLRVDGQGRAFLAIPRDDPSARRS